MKNYSRSSHQRPYKKFNSTAVTSRTLTDILPQVFSKITSSYANKGILVLAAWPKVIGPALEGMTKAESFRDGILYVKVKNSTLYSLLCQFEKNRLLKILQDMFPQVVIKTISFRIG